MIPIKQGPVGVLVSGGADSAMLLYLLMKYHADKIYIFTLASSLKNNVNSKHAIDVVSKCSELTSNQNFIHLVSYCHTQTTDKLFKNADEYLENGTINWLYTGITKNPPDKVLHEFQDYTTEDHARDPKVIRQTIYEDSKIITPFTNIDKKDLADLYKQHNLLETVFPLTRSCESLLDLEGQCGICWWCEERKWGFGRLV